MTKAVRPSQVSFRPLSRADFPLLRKWLETAHVKAFWDTDIVWTDDLIEEKYGSYVDGYKLINGLKKQVHALIIYLEGNPIGYAQYYNAFDFPREGYDLKKIAPLPSSMAALDLFIGEAEMTGRGLGSTIIQELLKHYIQPQFEACLVDPDLTNERAIRAYEKAGFRKIGVAAGHALFIWRQLP